jgi:sulfhydrogenase subunit beta (sulfur reductase)
MLLYRMSCGSAMGVGKSMQRWLDSKNLSDLLETLRAEDREVIAPKVEDGAIVYAPITDVDDLPRGIRDDQSPGRYRLVRTGDDVYFDHTAGPHTWKRFLYPPEQKLFSAHGGDAGFVVKDVVGEPPNRVFFGVRSCDLAAIRILDRVFDNGAFADRAYYAKREATLIVAVNCGRPGGTCFCSSMGTGPKTTDGFDLAMTEVTGEEGGFFVIEAGTKAGENVLDSLGLRAATATEIQAAKQRIDGASRRIGRSMIPDAAEVLARHLTSPHWDEIAKRCLNCANCTMACPTCFCSTVEDFTDLSGEHAERWRKWDSCFTMDFSYIHGGSLRHTGGARFRQWMTHKLLHWHEQFDISGCVGCGRCITWCPVGIDITEEARAIKDGEGRT